MKTKLVSFQAALRRRSGDSPSPSPMIIDEPASRRRQPLSYSPARSSELATIDYPGDKRDCSLRSKSSIPPRTADDRSYRLRNEDVHASHSPVSQQSYWDKAHQQLLDTKPELAAKLDELLRSSSTPSGTLDEDLRNVIYRNLTRIVDRQWRIRWGTRNILIREQLDKIATGVLIFNTLGNVASNLDPLHAGLAWAGVSMLIPIIVSFSEQEKAAQSGLDKITNLLARYAIVERKLIMNMDPDILATFESALIELYANVLEYQVIAACYYGKHTFRRYIRAVPKLDDFTGLLVEIQAKDDVCRGFIQLGSICALSYQARQLSQEFSVVEQTIQEFKNRDRDNEDVLLWLSDVRYGIDHEQARLRLGSKYTNTGRWFFQNTDVINWRPSECNDRPVLWLRGPVGTGKTSLMSIAIQDCLKHLEPSAESSFAYFYCTSKGQQPSSPLDILRCLVSQLSWSIDGFSLSPIVKDLYTRANRVSGTGKPDLESCVDLLIALGQTGPRVVAIIDALDECSDVFTLLACLQKIISNLHGKMQLFISSRLHVDVYEYFPGCPTIGIEKNSEDIDYYIQTEISCRKSRLSLGVPFGFEERLLHVLSRRAENMFRWVELQLETVFSPKSRLIHVKDIEAKLSQLEVKTVSGTDSLNAVYDEIYEMNTPQPYIRALATKALQWVLLTSLPPVPGCKTNRDAISMMKCSELAHAVSVDTDGSRDPSVNEDYILNICSNLVVVKEDRFQLAHLSVAEYLKSKKSEQYSEEEIHSQIALSCLSSLLSISKRDIFKRYKPDFDRYAMQWWPYHYRYSRSSQMLRSQYELFMTSDDGVYLQQWIEDYIANSSRSSPNILFQDMSEHEKPSPRFVAAVFGFQAALNQIESADLEARNDNGRSLFDVAAKYGWPSLVEQLWRTGGSQGCDPSRALLSVVSPGNMLIWGSGDYVFVLKLLLDLGADIEYRDELLKTPLMLSGELQYQAVFGALLGHGADIRAKDINGNTFFHLLFNKESFNPSDNYWIWSLIQENGDLNVRNKKGETPLHTLLRKSCDGFLWKTVRLYFMKRLLDSGADIYIPDNDGTTPQMLMNYQYDRHVEDYYNSYQYDVNPENLMNLKLLLYT